MNEKTKELKGPKVLKNDFIGNEVEVSLFTEVTHSEHYKMATTFAEQIGLICSKLKNDKINVSYQRIANAFGVSRQLVRKDHWKYKRGEGIDGRPSKLTATEISELRAEIARLHLGEIYPSIDYLSNFILEKFHKNLYSDTVRHIIRKEFANSFKSLPGVPYDDNRFNVNICDIEQNLNILKTRINGVPLRFVLNLDEMGHSDFEDAQQIHLIVPINYTKSTVPYPVSRATKHATCLACINAFGLFCPPQYIIQRTSIDSEIYDHLSPETFQVVHTESGYINTDAFSHWFTTIFLPNLREARKKYNYYGPAVLIMDGLAAHKIAIQKLNIYNDNLIVHFLPAHSSDQTQPLDLGVFAVAKRFMLNYHSNFIS